MLDCASDFDTPMKQTFITIPNTGKIIVLSIHESKIPIGCINYR